MRHERINARRSNRLISRSSYCHNNVWRSPWGLWVHRCRNSKPHSNRLILGWFTIQHSYGHRGPEPCLMCGCCVTLWPQTVWRATVTESQGQGEGGWGWAWAASDGLKGSLSGRAEPRLSQPSIWGETVSCVNPFRSPRPTLSVPTHLRGPGGGTRDCWCLESGGVIVPRLGRDTNLNITNPFDADKHTPTDLIYPFLIYNVFSLSHLY